MQQSPESKNSQRKNLPTKNIVGGRLVLPEACVPGAIHIQDEKIAEIVTCADNAPPGPAPGGPQDHSAQGCYVAPGFIDLHIQGFARTAVAKATGDAIPNMARAMLPFGTTAYLATLGYKPGILTNLLPWVHADTGGATMLGLYLEGPFISPGRLGAIPPAYCMEPDPATLESILDEAHGHLRIMTVAPELEGSLRLIEELDTAGVTPAIGHTLATYDQAMRGIEAGQRHTTHLFNAMTGLDHREPGAVGAVLAAAHVSAELIADGIHIHPTVLKMAIGIKGPEKVAVITDAMPAAGLDGESSADFMGNGANIVDGAPRLADGTLAGSVLTPIKALENLVRLVGLPLHTAVRMLTLTPASVAGMAATKGSLEKGKDADLVIFNDQFEVQATFVGGKLAWQR